MAGPAERLSNDTDGIFPSCDLVRTRVVRRGCLGGRTGSGHRRISHVRPSSCRCLNALTVNIVFKFIDKVLLFRNYSLEQIADGDNANHFFAFEHR